MRILGIDTSLRSSGFAIIESKGTLTQILDCGLIKNKTSLTQSQCLLRINNALEQLIYEYKPDEVAIESPFFPKNAKTAMILGMAKGVVICSATKAKLPVFEYAPKKAKQAIVGSGMASKQQVATVIASLLNVDINSIKDDATDAMAIALCHINQRNITSIKKKFPL